MKLPKTFLMLSSVILLASCAEETRQPVQDVVVQTEFVSPEFEIQVRPRPVNMANVEFDVVTEENLDKFLREVAQREGRVVFIATSVEHYENMSLNLAALREYIAKQNAIILYYEETLSGS